MGSGWLSLGDFDVLVPITRRPNLSAELWHRAVSNFHALKGKMAEQGWTADAVLFDAEYPKWYPEENFFARLARMRNAVIDEHLSAEHEWVMWIDVDISFEPDLFDRLYWISPLRPAIRSPMVLIEGTDQNYDTAGFREHFERRSLADPPWFDDAGPVISLKSVGGVVLVPAHVHRQCRFSALPDDDKTWNTEWWNFCECARLNGMPVVVDTRIHTYHAELPKYGEPWH